MTSNNPLYMDIKPHTEYTESEIIALTKRARNAYEYDAIIDKLYFVDGSKNRKHQKNRLEYSVLTGQTMKQRRKQEVAYNPEISDVAGLCVE